MNAQSSSFISIFRLLRLTRMVLGHCFVVGSTTSSTCTHSPTLCALHVSTIVVVSSVVLHKWTWFTPGAWIVGRTSFMTHIFPTDSALDQSESVLYHGGCPTVESRSRLVSVPSLTAPSRADSLYSALDISSVDLCPLYHSVDVVLQL